MSIESRQQDNFAQTNNDEINLLEIFLKIWKGKFLIIGIVLVSAVIAFISLKMMTSYFKIDTTIDVATADQIRVLAPSVTGSTEYQVPILDAKKIYDRVLLQANSLPLLKAFWEKRTGKPLLLNPGDPVSEENQGFRKFYESFVIEASNPKTPEVTARKISLEYRDPVSGIKLINDYLDFLNQQALLGEIQRLESSYNANLSALAVSYSARNLIEQRKLDDELVKIRENLKIAESLGIKETPFRELENIQLKVLDSRDYLIGTKPLSQQIDILVARQGKSLAPFSADLRNMETWRDQMTVDLERLKVMKDKVRLFSVINKPDASPDPVKPKKTLIFIVIVFLSGILGIAIVLIRGAVQSHRKV